MNSLMPIVGTAAVLGTAIVGGVFFGFSSFIMKALGRVSAPEGLAAMFFLGGAVLYFAGTFLVTMFGNVALNDRLASVSPSDPAAAKFWMHYLDRWTMWNTVRTIAAIAATFLFTVGLIQNGG